MRYPGDRDGMEPKLVFRLSSGYEFSVVLPVGIEWTEEIIRHMQTPRPFVMLAEIRDWRGVTITNLRDDIPYKVKPQKDDS